jgi:hypothetical protein
MNRSRVCQVSIIVASWIAPTGTLAAAPLSTTFTYQGRLKSAGQPFNGSANLVFKLYDASSTGNLLGTQTLNGVVVTGGLFTVQLNAAGEFGANALNGERRWLEIAVNGTPLTPRQELTAAPYALQTRGIFVDDAYRVGMGTLTPGMSLEVSNPSYYGKPALGASDAGAYAYLHVSSTYGHSLIWDALHAMRFGTEASRGTGYTERMRLSPAGYLGIGTQSPRGPLDVASGDGSYFQMDAVTGDIHFNGGSDGGFGFINDSSNPNAATGIVNHHGVPIIAAYNDGRVGINATSPRRALDVNGAVDASEGFSVWRNQDPFPAIAMGVNGNGQGELYAYAVYAAIKSFRVPNPREAGTDIVYASIEGPEAAAYVRGTARLVNGRARVELPDHFASIAVLEGMTITLTPGSFESKGLAWADKTLTGFDVGELHNGKGSYEFDWEVKAVRKGYEDYLVIRPAVAGLRAQKGGQP